MTLLEALPDESWITIDEEGEGRTRESDHLVRPSMRERLLTRSQLHDLPDPQPLIDDTIDLRTVALLVGNRSTGKTFIALDWACSIATARPWQGRPSQPGRVLYVAAEGAYGLNQRIQAWETAWKRDVVDLDIYPEPVNLMANDPVAELAAIAAGYTLIVIDTLARCARGADENSARDMGIVVDSAYRIRGHTPRSVLLVHHTGKDRETTRGSSALEAGVDTVYLVEGDAGLLKLTRTKRKDGPTDDRHMLRLNATHNSVVIESAAGGQNSALLERSDRLLSTFMSTFGDTGATRAELEKVADMPHATYFRALKDLIDAGLLTNHGTDTRPRYYPTNLAQES